MPLEQICLLFEDLYGYGLNSETVERVLAEGYELCEAKVKQKVRSGIFCVIRRVRCSSPS